MTAQPDRAFDFSWKPAAAGPAGAGVGTLAEADYHALRQHLETHLGQVHTVWREVDRPNPSLLPLDVLHVVPDADRPYHTLVTCGMSSRPMAVPADEEVSRYAELMVRLPENWPLSPEALADPDYGWPMWWLKRLARLPSETGGWIGPWHTIPNGDPPAPLWKRVRYVAWLTLPPLFCPEDFAMLPLADRNVQFWSVLPLYQQELDCKLNRGMAALLDAFAEEGFSDVVTPDRLSAISPLK